MTSRASFLALGDSYTIGEGVTEAERWPTQLAHRLRAEGCDVDDPQIIATTGWTTDELADALDAIALTPGYGLVTLLIGVNNQYRGRDAQEYRQQFHQLLERAVALAGGHANHVVVVSIPDWGMSRFARDNGRDADAVGRALDYFNSLARVEATRAGAAFVDITDLSRSYPDELVDDGLHPDAQQYARWAERIVPAALAALD